MPRNPRISGRTLGRSRDDSISRCQVAIILLIHSNLFTPKRIHLSCSSSISGSLLINPWTPLHQKEIEALKKKDWTHHSRIFWIPNWAFGGGKNIAPKLTNDRLLRQRRGNLRSQLVLLFAAGCGGLHLPGEIAAKKWLAMISNAIANNQRLSTS